MTHFRRPPAPRRPSVATRPPFDLHPDISVVIPVRNEEQNIAPLWAELLEVMKADERRYEIIFINDGSDDGTADELDRIAATDSRCIVIEFARRFGQSAGMNAGFRMARGDVVVPMDGDLQNDPHDIPMLVSALDEPPGFDIVSGWRKERHDKLFTRRLPSLLANRLIRRLTWSPPIHDFGCTLKAYRREVLADINLYGEMHRFLPALCRWRGARITERVVNHRPRIAGKTKYGLKRTVKVLFDLITVKFLGEYLTKPIYFFGKLALGTFSISITSVAIAIVQKFGYLTEYDKPVNLNNSIFILFAMMMFITTGMLLMLGVISELLIRIYYESRDLAPYRVRRVIRGGQGQPPVSAK